MHKEVRIAVLFLPPGVGKDKGGGILSLSHAVSCHEIFSPRSAANILDWILTFLNRMPTLLLRPRR